MPYESSYLTVNQFAEKHSAFPRGGLRHKIFHAATNGLNKYKVIIRDGRRVLINEARFFKWLESSNNVGRA
jgi:hypothetical protein